MSVSIAQVDGPRIAELTLRAAARAVHLHLRQHEDGRGQGPQGQGSHRQRTLLGAVRAGRAVGVPTRLYPGRVQVVADDKVVACHERLSNRGETRYDW